MNATMPAPNFHTVSLSPYKITFPFKISQQLALQISLGRFPFKLRSKTSMRPALVASSPVDHVIHMTPKLSSIAKSASNYSYNPRLRTYYTSGSFEANLAIILVVLICALICALALNSAIRCFLRSNSSQITQQQQRQEGNTEDDKIDVVTAAATPMVFSFGIKLAGTEAECAICLSEFVVGEEIQVLTKCKHGFHLQCIQKWLHSQSSCPTCRSSCLQSS